MENDIHVFFGIKIKGKKYVAQEIYPIDEYDLAKYPKTYLDVRLERTVNMIKNKLKEEGLL